jgi:hypothetical protein
MLNTRLFKTTFEVAVGTGFETELVNLCKTGRPHSPIVTYN